MFVFMVCLRSDRRGRIVIPRLFHFCSFRSTGIEYYDVIYYILFLLLFLPGLLFSCVLLHEKSTV